MLRFKFHGLGFSDDEHGASSGGGIKLPDGFASNVGSGGIVLPDSFATSIGQTGFFSTPLPAAPSIVGGGFVMPIKPLTPTLMPGMPGYIAPTPWYSGPAGIILLAALALVGYKVLLAD